MKICEEDPENKEAINKSLNKIGLFFQIEQKIDDNGEIIEKIPKIIIKDESLRNQVSMCRRCRYSMPSTTNSLEAIHGHLNSRTPRRNSLFSSIARIHNEMISKFMNINSKIKHNYQHLKKLTKDRIPKKYSTVMNQECTHYQTTIQSCLCSENKLASSNCHMDVPCHHRVYLGASFPQMPERKLNLEHQFEKFEVLYDFISAEKDPSDEITDEIKYIIRTIKFFSHYKNEGEIKEYIELHYTANNGFFINNQKVSVIQLIENGIFHFHKIKKKKSKSTTS